MSTSVTFTIAGPDAAKLKQRIQDEALIQGLSMSEWITNAVAEYLRNQVAVR